MVDVDIGSEGIGHGEGSGRGLGLLKGEIRVGDNHSFELRDPSIGWNRPDEERFVQGDGESPRGWEVMDGFGWNPSITPLNQGWERSTHHSGHHPTFLGM